MVGPLINQNNKEEIRQVAQNMLGSLMDKVDHNKLELLRTLYIFLANGGNLEQTASENALSLSGLGHRISRIENLLTHRDMRDPFIPSDLFSITVSHFNRRFRFKYGLIKE